MSDPRATNQAAIKELLSRLAYLREAGSLEEVTYLLRGAQTRPVLSHTILFSQGQQVEHVYLLLNGRMEELRTGPGIGVDDGIRLRESSPGALLGLYDLVYGRLHSTWARAVDDCTVIAIPAAEWNRLLFRYPALRSSMLPVKKIERLRTIPLLAAADLPTIGFLADATELREVRTGEVIYQPGDSAVNLYLIDQGQIRLERNHGEVLWLGNGAEFGLEERTGASAVDSYSLHHTAVAACPTRLLVIPRRQFVALTGISPERESMRLRRLRRETLERIGVFADWTAEERRQLLGYMSHYVIPNNHLLAQQGEVADSMWVLLPGKRAFLHALTAADEALPQTPVRGPAHFVESALSSPTIAPSTVEAEAGSTWLRLHSDDFHEFVSQTGRSELPRKLRVDQEAQPFPMEGMHRRYPWLAANEQVVLASRRHWVIAIWKLVPAFLFGLLTLLAAVVWGAMDGGNWLVRGTVILLALATAGLWWWGIIDYLNDYLIITNLRVIRQEKVIFIREDRHVAPLEQVQDVAWSQGFWGRVWGYAQIEVQTPGPAGNIFFDGASHYLEVSKRIQQERDRRKRHYQASAKKEIYTVLESRLGVTLDLPARVWIAPPAPLRPSVISSVRMAMGRSAAPATSPAGNTPVRRVWHKHWIILVRNIMLPLALILALLAGAAAIALLDEASQLRGYSLPLVSVLIWFAVAACLWLLWMVEDWRNDRYILESDRLVDIEETPLGLSRSQRVASLSEIVDIQMKVPSPLHFLLGFGSVYVQTAAQDGGFTFVNVPHPAAVVEEIRGRMDQIRQAEEKRHARTRAQEFPDWLEAYDRLSPPRSGMEEEEER